MNTFLLIIITIISLATFAFSVVSTIIVAKYTNLESLVMKIFKIIGIVLSIILVLVIAASVSLTNKSALETAGFTKLSIDEYLELIKEENKNIILVARPTCTYCEKFSPILKQASDDLNLDINYVNTDEFTNEDWEKFNNSLKYLSTEDWGTPLTLIVQNSDVVAANGGYVELETIKSFFIENGFGE